MLAAAGSPGRSSRCWRSTASSAAAIPRRRSRPRRCSRRPRASSASTRAAPCASRSSCTKAVDIGEGSVGLITYMRTDSVTLAEEAVTEIREVAARLYGKAKLADEPRIYKTKSKNAQEAHEAIRPTSAAITPADVEGKIERRPVQALRADLEARGRLADEPRRVRHRRGRPARRRRRRAAPPAARQRLDAGEAGLHRGVPGRTATTRRSTTPITCCRR